MVQELAYEMANAVMNHTCGWSDLGQVFTTGFENGVQSVMKGLYDPVNYLQNPIPRYSQISLPFGEV